MRGGGGLGSCSCWPCEDAIGDLRAKGLPAWDLECYCIVDSKLEGDSYSVLAAYTVERSI